MNVTNNSTNPLGLPGNEPIPPGATVKVENWDDIKDLDTIKLFLKREVIATGGKLQDAPVPDAVDVSPAAQLAVINARNAAAESRVEPEVEAEQPVKRKRAAQE